MAEPQQIDFDEQAQGDLLACTPREPETAADPVPDAAPPVVEAESFEAAARPAKRSPKAKAPRKGGARRASADDGPKIAEPAPSQEVEAAIPAPSDEAGHSNIEPLFEPEPFVRMPRPAFGRKAG